VEKPLFFRVIFKTRETAIVLFSDCMRKVHVFLALVVAALAALAVLEVVGFTVFTAPTGSSPTSQNWMSNMGNMMGGTPEDRQ
jgi:hypothetical protein